jgi:SAM-dependent methyltransferase
MAEDDAASFRKPAAAYDRFVGRYGPDLAASLIEGIGLSGDWRALDVGCGPGPLTSALAEVLGADRVAAVDPSEPFARACAERVPGADVRVGSAESLPFEDGEFDVTLSQLVVNFMPDAPAGLREMHRVTRPGGVVASSVWDYAGEMTMLRAFWDAAGGVDPEGAGPLDEGTRMRYCRPDELAELWTGAGLTEVETGSITVTAAYADFEDLWGPFTAGVGPAGSYCASLPDSKRDELKTAYRRRLGSPDGAFELSARAWTASGRAGRSDP